MLSNHMNELREEDATSGIAACMRLNARLTAKLNHWKEVMGFNTPEEGIDAINERFAKELPQGLAKSLWRLESADNIKLREENQRLRKALEHLATSDGEGVCDRLCMDYARDALKAIYG